MARPSSYKPKIGDKICAELAIGQSLRSICTGPGMPKLAPRLNTVENAADAMPELLHMATARYCRDAGLGGNSAGYGLAEIYMAGWSEAEGRMRSWCWLNIEDYAPRDDDGGAHYGLHAVPALPAEDIPGVTGSLDEQLVAIMLAERRYFETHSDLGVMVGGEVQCWTLTAHGLSQRVIHRFEDARRPHAGADLLERVVSGAEPFNLAERLVPAAEMRCPAA